MKPEIKLLIEEYSELPKLKQESNYLDIMGFSHYEDVISNILNFFLHPHKEHDLQDLLLRSLLELCENDFSISGINYVKSKREKKTHTGKRIDLLIETNAYIIVIENKIYHTLENDLDDYSKFADSINPDPKKKIVKIVLTLNELKKDRDIKKMDGAGFENITYKEYLKQIRKNYSIYALDGNTKYLILLNDLIKSLENRIGQSMEKVKKWDFFENKIELIEELLLDYNLFVNDYLVNQKMNPIKEKVKLDKIVRKNRFELQDTLVLDFEFGKNEIAIDVSISTKGYRIEMFERGKSNEFIQSEEFIELTQIEKLNELTKNGRYLHKEFELKTKTDDVISEIEKFTKKIAEANKVYNFSNR